MNFSANEPLEIPQEELQEQIANEEKPPEEPKKRERRKVQQHLLKPEMITDKKGLQFLYQRSKDYPFVMDELSELDRFMKIIEEWHYNIMPKYDQSYFLDRLRNFGNTSSVKTQLQMMRKAHKGLIPWEYIGTGGITTDVPPVTQTQVQEDFHQLDIQDNDPTEDQLMDRYVNFRLPEQQNLQSSGHHLTSNKKSLLIKLRSQPSKQQYSQSHDQSYIGVSEQKSQEQVRNTKANIEEVKVNLFANDDDELFNFIDNIQTKQKEQTL